MPIETRIEMLAAICFFVIGFSHIFQPRAWAEVFIHMRGKGAAGSLLNALLHFPLGALIVSFHNVWSGIPLVLTLIGWGLVFKSSIYFLFPGYGMNVLSRVSVERSWMFVPAGFFSVALGGLFTFSILNR